MTDTALPLATSLIAEFEAFRSAPYKDTAGVWTIGYGFTYLPTMQPVTSKTPPMSEPDARAWLQTIVTKTMTAVRDMVYVPISDNTAASLCSFAYNEGTHALFTSTLMDRLNAKEPLAVVAECLDAWVYAGGRYSRGLANRRKIEKSLFLKPAAEVSADDLNVAELKRITVSPRLPTE